MRPLLLLTVVLVAVHSAAIAAAAPPGTGGTVIAGGDLPQTVRLAAADEDAFVRRIGPPPKFENAPSVVSGASYRITSAYWDYAVRGTREDRPPAEAAATYYPQAGFVRARQNGQDVWLVLDPRQRAVIDRYIRLTREGLLSREPGLLEVLRAAAASETISVSVGGHDLTGDQRRQFWELTQSLRPQTGAAATPLTSGSLPSSEPVTSIVFGLYEGRSLPFLYAVNGGTVVDLLGSETYSVPPRWLVPVLGQAAAPGETYDLQPARIEQQEGTGSALWWPVMLGGGAAALAVAGWLNRDAKRRVMR